jgi:glycosyltransferase involved in cell wall biosynthesis
MKKSKEMPTGQIRLLLLGDARQVHLKRWAQFFLEADYAVLTISLENVREFCGEKVNPPVPSLIPGCVRYPLAVPFIKRTLTRFRPHIINAHFLPNYGMIAALINASPWILSTWGSDIMLLPEKSFLHKWRTRFVIGRADFITSDARVMSKKLVKLGCNPGRILTVPYGVDANVFNARARTDTINGPKILSNRKLERVYNIEMLLDAFSLVQDSLADARLSIVGNGSLRKALIARAKKSFAGRHVTFTAEVEHKDVPELLCSHDIYVSVSLSDTTSVSLLEAMACGVFPIVSDIPANREWIQNGENGLLVPVNRPDILAEAIKTAWNDRALRENSQRINAEIIAQRANWQKNMESVNELFKKALKQASTKGR